MKKNNNLIIKHVNSNLVKNINSDNLVECAEGVLIDSYLFILDDNPIYQNLLDDANMFIKEHDYSHIDQLLNDFNYVYILEAYCNEWGSDHTYIFTDNYLDDNDDIFYIEDIKTTITKKLYKVLAN